MKKIAYVGYKIQEQYNHGVSNNEDEDLFNFLVDKGHNIATVIWNDESVEWNNFDVVILKSPWDYHEKIHEFYEWLNILDSLKIKVLNPTNIIRWNSHKKYLKTLENDGFKVVPTAILDKEDDLKTNYFTLFNSEKLVLKPCVSAGAKNTIVIKVDDFTFDLSNRVKELIKNEDYLIQPFIKEISEGEWSFIFFNKEFSHCVLKTPKQGDFRVHHYLGGSIDYPIPEKDKLEEVKTYLDFIEGDVLYTRIDGVYINGVFHLMELELIEPYLFFNEDNNRLNNYYKAFLNLLS